MYTGNVRSKTSLKFLKLDDRLFKRYWFFLYLFLALNEERCKSRRHYNICLCVINPQTFSGLVFGHMTATFKRTIIRGANKIKNIPPKRNETKLLMTFYIRSSSQNLTRRQRHQHRWDNLIFQHFNSDGNYWGERLVFLLLWWWWCDNSDY